MYDYFHENEAEILVYRTSTREFVTSGAVQTEIPENTLVGFDGERNTIHYGQEIYTYSTELFVQSTKNIKFNDIIYTTQGMYRKMYQDELNLKLGITESTEVINYGNAIDPQNTQALALMNTGLMFKINRM